jgi:hypothetical protein
MNATIATIEMIANAVHIDAINERTDTITIVERDMNVINTNADTSTTNSIATKNKTKITNAINIDATNCRKQRYRSRIAGSRDVATVT